MASSLISSSHYIDFDSVFGIDDTGLVQMFETLIATGLKEFLGCPTVFYEAALTEFFENSSVRDGVVVSTIKGTAIEISENIFATNFGLPVDGLTDLSEVPKNLVSDAPSLFSDSKEHVSISCLKKKMKIQYRLLSDILAKTLYVKAGSFDVVTRDRFMLMTAITFDVKVNWSSLLFGVLQDMVTPGSRQAKGFAIQICVLLKNVPGLVLGESREFPASRVLTEKTVHWYVTINEKVGMEETADAPRVKKTPAKKTVSTKRPVGDGEEAPIVKKKRTTKGKPLVIAQESVPIQSVKATTDASTEQSPAPKRKSQKRKRRLILEGDDEIVDSAPEQPAAEAATDVQDSEVENEQAVTAADSVTVEKVVERVDEPVPELAVADFERVGEQPAVETVEEATTDDGSYYPTSIGSTGLRHYN
ncbi:delphilin-like [Dorcoceras hygrometricum]|uniref:Delphilin-like n=1 Tax=Dorcoceras hygrometricum TaxID=472368 RepID=A0A2Z7C880_9LAMI|nr:delphilin-like [Dorcoceras hygrometricum]